MAPQEKMFFTAIVPCDKEKEACSEDTASENPGKRVFDQAVRLTKDGKLGMGFGPIVPHTTSEKSQPCDRCHLREDQTNWDVINELIGRGSNRFKIPDGNDTVYDLTKVLNGDDSAAVGLAHSGSAVLSRDTIQRILKPRVADSGLTLKQYSDWVSPENTNSTANNPGDTVLPDGPGVSASDCQTAGLEPASVTLGTGSFRFKALEDGDNLFVQQGTQGGGRFVQLRLQAAGIYPGSKELGSSSYPRLTFTLQFEAEQLLVEQALARLFRLREDTGQLEFSGESLLLKSANTTTTHGQPATLGISLEDACGTTTSVAVEIIIQQS
jgi:hypothetical protein